MTHHLPQAKALKKLGIPEPVLEFEISPEPWRKKPFRWTVKIFSTRGQMRRYLKFSRPDRKHDDDYAFTDQKAMEIAFCLWTCSDNCVAHELFHSVVWWISRTFHNHGSFGEWDHRNHERAAEAMGNMVSQFWEKFSKKSPRSACWGFGNLKAK